ncbi:YbaK/EbsC family protein [Demequina muriae]|uniref:YbaK/EbsC family protein n=1 Tax=Demequina muriae TaxID=3051664 RepID=A0ABT8GD96_9MICO|nr:YbaK/EbsC family protein [Demequina sp. EGI L300058]MDN4479397.1 YbaK/EbsC family protein [Demequina sp. EGI L300058]
MHPNVQKVKTFLDEAGLHGRVRELTEGTHTAAQAAALLGCEVGAIANSLIFMTEKGPILVLTSGAHRVDTDVVAAAIGAEAVSRATPDQVRAATGQPIGGVAPIGHPAPLPTYLDVELAEHGELWAAAGVPASVFEISYADLKALTGAVEIAVE